MTRRAALVLSVLRGETSAAEAARKHGLTVEEGRERFLAGAANGLRRRPRAEEGIAPPPGRGRALLGKLIGKLQDRGR